MRIALFLAACLACAGHGRRAHNSNQQLQRRSVWAASNETLPVPLKSLAVLLLSPRPTATFNPSNQGIRLHSARPVHAQLPSVASERLSHLLRRVPVIRAAVPGKPDADDQESFEKDPAAFCEERMKKHGNTFVTGAFGGATFLGDAGALTSLTGSAAPSKEPLAAPFAWLPKNTDGTDPFKQHEDYVNNEAHAGYIDLLIPIYYDKGFSLLGLNLEDNTVQFKPAMRNLVLNAAAPYLFGVPADEVYTLLGLPMSRNFYVGYRAYARQFLGGESESGEIPAGQERLLYDLGLKKKGATEDELEIYTKAMDTWAKKSGRFPDGATALYEITSTVEQIVALVGSMLVAEKRDESMYKELISEVKAACKGKKPTEGPGSADLAQMPKLDAFAKEVMRFSPPARPARRVLQSPLEGNGYSLAAGTVVAPEPLLAHFDPSVYSDPGRFNPKRWEDADSSSKVLMPFATAADKVPGEEEGEKLVISIAKVLYSWFGRMFEDVKIEGRRAEDEMITPKGYPLSSVSERMRIEVEPRTFYFLTSKKIVPAGSFQ